MNMHNYINAKRLARGAFLCALLIGCQAELRPAANENSTIASYLIQKGILNNATLGFVAGSAVSYCAVNPVHEYAGDDAANWLSFGLCLGGGVLSVGGAGLYTFLGVIKAAKALGLVTIQAEKFSSMGSLANFALGFGGGMVCEGALYPLIRWTTGRMIRGYVTEERRIANHMRGLTQVEAVHNAHLAALANLQPDIARVDEYQAYLSEAPALHAAEMRQAEIQAQTELGQLQQEWIDLDTDAMRLEQSIFHSKSLLPADSFAVPASFAAASSSAASSSAASSSSSSSNSRYIGWE